MVKRVEASAFVPELSPQDVFDRVFAAPEAVQAYHAECNKDPNARVGAWEGGRREVVFATRVNAPAALTRTLGIETLTIREVFTREDASGGVIVVNSEPILDFPGGSRFTTSSSLRLSPAASGCQMSVDISCAAAGPWGLVGTIEDTMAAQARDTIDGFLAFCVSWCCDVRDRSARAGEEQVLQPPIAVAAERNGDVSRSSSTDEETFFDASPATPSSASQASGFGPPAPAAELRQLSARLRKVEAAVQALQAQQQEKIAVGRTWGASVASFAFAAVVVGSVAIVALEYGRRAGMRSMLAVPPLAVHRT